MIELLCRQSVMCAVCELQQKAREVVNFRQQKIRELQMDKEYEIISRKAELHDAEYRELRKEQLDRGRRINSLYRSKRTKEVVDKDVKPQLCIVVKGEFYTDSDHAWLILVFY